MIVYLFLRSLQTILINFEFLTFQSVILQKQSWWFVSSFTPCVQWVHFLLMKAASCTLVCSDPCSSSFLYNRCPPSSRDWHRKRLLVLLPGEIFLSVISANLVDCLCLCMLIGNHVDQCFWEQSILICLPTRVCYLWWPRKVNTKNGPTFY